MQASAPRRTFLAVAGVLMIAAGILLSGWPLVLGGFICLVLAAIVGVVGALQLDVLADRLEHEYGVPASFEPSRNEVLRWISCDDKKKLEDFIAANRFSIATDLDGDPVLMAQSAFSLNYTLERSPGIKVATIKEIHG